MTAPKKNLDIVLRWLKPLKHKFTSSPRLRLLSGIALLCFLSFALFQYNQEKYSDELGFTGENKPYGAGNRRDVEGFVTTVQD